MKMQLSNFFSLRSTVIGQLEVWDGAVSGLNCTRDLSGVNSLVLETGSGVNSLVLETGSGVNSPTLY